MSAFTATGPVYYENIWVPFQVWNFGYEVASKTYERALPVIQPSGPKSGWTRKEQNNFYDSSKSGERVEVVLFAAWAFTIGLMVASVDYKIHTRKYNQETLRLKSLN